MKIKNKNLCNIINLILMIIVIILIIIVIYCVFARKDSFISIANNESGIVNDINKYSSNEIAEIEYFDTSSVYSNRESNILYGDQINTTENSNQNIEYYESNGKIVGVLKLDTSNKGTYDVNNQFDRYTLIYSKKPSLDEVTSSVKEGTVTPNGVTIIIIDNNEAHYGYSKRWYSIEKKTDERWESLNLKKDMIISDEEDIPTIYSDRTEITIDWAEYYGELEKGIYRIAKKAYVYNQDFEGTYVYTEFEIK